MEDIFDLSIFDIVCIFFRRTIMLRAALLGSGNSGIRTFPSCQLSA